MQCITGSGSCRRAQEHIRSKEFRASRNHLITFGRYGIAKNQVTCSCGHPSNRSKIISKRAHCELPRSATPHITPLNCPRQNTIPKIGRPKWRRCRRLQNMTGHSVPFHPRATRSMTAIDHLDALEEFTPYPQHTQADEQAEYDCVADRV